jgi:hypothetical protein
MIDDWPSFLLGKEEDGEARLLQATRTGRPAGVDAFVEMLESATGRILKPRKPGRRRKK